MVSDVAHLLPPGELSHLLLTSFPSGHTLGGTLFKIRSPTSGTVLYAVGMNHTGERHLDGMVGGEPWFVMTLQLMKDFQVKGALQAMKRGSCVPIYLL